LDAYLKEALQKTNTNMKNQHSSMRKHLQTRHLQLETNIRSDIFDSQNDLGKGIVTAQNALGQAIVDSRNVNGQAIVDARNANSDQHNAISKWLHENLCTIYAALSGTCTEFIGPLPEEQTFTPMVLSWPEGQLNVMDRLDQMEVMGAGIHEAVTGIEKTLTIGTSFEEKGETTHGFATVKPDSTDDEMDAMQENAMQGQMDEIKDKVDDIQKKMDKVDDMQKKMDKMDDMQKKMDDIGSKIDDLSKLISHIMQQNMKIQEE